MVLAPSLLPVVAPAVCQPQPRLRRRRRLQTPRLSVVIVNYHQWENTAALVRQLRAAPCMRVGAAEVVVVDNDSPSHPLARRLRRWAGVSLRRWGRNRGFARAVNEGSRLSRGEWFLLLNPDMTLTPGFLDGVLALANRLTAEEPRAGIVGFALRNSDGSQQLSSGPFPTLLGTLAGLALPRGRRKYYTVAGRQRCEVEWVTGCCLLVRRDCLQSLGGLDEDFFLYYEDVDLCWRARQLGWSVWYEPNQVAIHHHPLHGRAVPPALRLVTRHSLLTYAAKHWPRWQLRLLGGIVRVESWARCLLARWRGAGAAVRLFGELGSIAADMGHGQQRRARQRLSRVTATADLHHQCARTQGQSASFPRTDRTTRTDAPCDLAVPLAL